MIDPEEKKEDKTEYQGYNYLTEEDLRFEEEFETGIDIDLYDEKFETESSEE